MWVYSGVLIECSPLKGHHPRVEERSSRVQGGVCKSQHHCEPARGQRRGEIGCLDSITQTLCAQ